MTEILTRVPGPPSEADLQRWRDADAVARPLRLSVLRQRMAEERIDAYFGVRRENIRYLTGLELAEGEEKVAGNSGQFLVAADEVVVFADSRYTVQAREQCSGARVERVYNDLVTRWPELLAEAGGARRVAVEAGFVSQAMWQRLAAAAPDVELVPIENWVEQQRQVKEPSEIERIASACAVADAALERLLPSIVPGTTEAELALSLEWEMRGNGAEALAFDVACLSGPRAALPHGSPGTRRIAAGEVLLFDFGAQVAGYRSDMTRTLFVGDPRADDLEIYALVARAQQASIDALAHALAAGERPNGRAIDGVARDVIRNSGHGDHYGHGLGHGIGLATHEMPSLGVSAPETPLPSPTVFSVEPGVYLDDVMGVRIEDLVLFDAEAGRIERLTMFPREVTVVG
ncbi:MAG TPA: Xaa-Pro peptidase family protein [Candidatus Limnocylindrales bacterium]|nr:Xaa-Pro peptidase family protein [Candidatus Limnocylindrales bacterium]